VYGTAPVGDKVTCIIGATGASYSTQINPDREFVVIIPKKAVAVRADDHESVYGIKQPADITINVTDRQNKLIASHGTNGVLPRWASERSIEKRKQDHHAIFGQQVRLAILTELNGDTRIAGRCCMTREGLISPRLALAVRPQSSLIPAYQVPSSD
jgi:hypothetical protein